jgi:hypothetical protein
VRGSEAISEDQAREVLALQKRVRELESKLEKASVGPPPGVEDLAQGDDIFVASVIVWGDDVARAHKSSWNKTKSKISLTWHEILSAIAPYLLAHASKASWIDALEMALEKAAEEGRCLTPFYRGMSVEIYEKSLSEIIIQLRVLGLIRPRGASGGFSLTEYGEKLTLKLNAISSASAPTEHLKPPQSKKNDW